MNTLLTLSSQFSVYIRLFQCVYTDDIAWQTTTKECNCVKSLQTIHTVLAVLR